MIRNLFYFLCLFFLSACGGQNEGVTKAESSPKNMVQKITTSHAFMENGDTIPLSRETLLARMFFVRHAEKDTIAKDPGLTPAGVLRSEKLANIFGQLALRRIYSTNYKRTLRTARPISNFLNLPVLLYSPHKELHLLDQLTNSNPGGNYLIVGHSNTINEMLNHLSGESVYQPIPNDVYDRLYVASVYDNGKVDILELNY